MANRFISKALHILGIEDDDRPVQQTASSMYAQQQTRRSANTYVPQSNRTEEMRRRTMVPNKQRSYQSDDEDVRGGYSSRTYTPSSSRAGSYDREYGAAQSSGAAPSRGYTRDNADYGDRQPVYETRSERQQAYEQRNERRPQPRQQSRPVRSANNPPAQRQNGGGAAYLTKYILHGLDECSRVVDSLLSGDIVLVLVDFLDEHTIQRVFDTLSGAAFALGAKVEKASETAYLITPKNVSYRTNRYETYSRRYTGGN